MNIGGKAPGRKKDQIDLRDRAAEITLKAENIAEEQVLAAIYRHFRIESNTALQIWCHGQVMKAAATDTEHQAAWLALTEIDELRKTIPTPLPIK